MVVKWLMVVKQQADDVMTDLPIIVQICSCHRPSEVFSKLYQSNVK